MPHFTEEKTEGLAEVAKARAGASSKLSASPLSTKPGHLSKGSHFSLGLPT